MAPRPKPARCGAKSRRHMGTPVDAEHLCKDHLDTWGRQEGKINTSPGRPEAAPMLESPRSPQTTSPRTLSTRSTTTRTYFDTCTQPRNGRPRRGPPGVQDRTGLHLYFLHPWDSGQEITRVQGIVAGGVQLRLFDRCRRRWRRLVQARSPGERGRGDFNGRRAAGLDFF